MKNLIIRMGSLQFVLFLILFILEDFFSGVSLINEPVIWLLRGTILGIFVITITLEFFERRSLLFLFSSIGIRVVASILLSFYNPDILYYLPILYIDIIIYFESKLLYISVLLVSCFFTGIIEFKTLILNSDFYRLYWTNIINPIQIFNDIDFSKAKFISQIKNFLFSTIFAFVFDLLKAFFALKKETIEYKDALIEKLRTNNEQLNESIIQLSFSLKEAVVETINNNNEKLEEFIFEKFSDLKNIELKEVYIHKKNPDSDLCQLLGRKIVTNQNNDMFYKKKIDSSFSLNEKSFEVYSKLLNSAEEGTKKITSVHQIFELTQEDYKYMDILVMRVFDKVFFITIGYQITNVEFKEFDIEEEKLFLLIKRKIMHDEKIENLKIKNEAYYKMALTDAMTGIYNRAFYEKYKNEIYPENSKYVGMICFDIDKFKSINDGYNHLVGDEVIKAFANIIKSSVRKEDYCIRIGGDEFVIIVEGPSLELVHSTAYTIGEKIRKEVEKKKFHIGNFKFSVTCSGGAYANKNTYDFEEIRRIADEALYVSKEAGRNKITLK